MPAEQSFKNHGRLDPIFHFFIVPILFANIIFSGVFYAHHHYLFAHSGLWFILISVVLFLLALKTRMYALKNQDRIIRLEEKQRLALLASPSELIELDSLTMRQYVALRFASNTELPELARRAIRENLTEKQIKAAIKAWRPDHDRI